MLHSTVDTRQARPARGRARRPHRGARLGPGDTLGSYTIEAFSRRGGFGSIYRGRHWFLERPVALKVLHGDLATDGSVMERFRNEAQVLARVHHPAVVLLHDYCELSNGVLFLVLEWLDGWTLADELRGSGRMAPAEAVDLIRTLCGALDAVHRLGVVHRDVKASNVMLTRAERGRQVKLIDFGIAKEPGARAGELTRTDARVGTPETMAPEQIRGGEVDRRTDVYGLGLLFYQLLTGQLPFRGATVEEVEQQHLHGRRPRASEHAPVTRGLDAVIERCLEPAREHRFDGTVELAAALEQFTGPPSAHPPVPGPPTLMVEVELRIPEAHADDDALFDAADRALDAARATLVGAGMTPTVDAGLTLLASCELPADRPAADRARRMVADAAEAVRTELARELPAVAARVDIGDGRP